MSDRRTPLVDLLIVMTIASLQAILTHDLLAQEFETPPVLSARDLVDPGLLSGPHHRVDDKVTNDGAMNHFLIRSDYGEFEAPSEEMLEIRVREVRALTRLAEISRSEVFATTLKSSAMAPATAVTNVVTDPVGTAKAIPASVGRAFRGFFYKGRKLAHKVEEGIEKRHEESKKEETDRTPAEGNGEGLSAREVAKSFFGYNSAMRELARKLQIDPYTSNELVRKELDRLAAAAFAAGLSFRAVVPSVSVVSYAEEVSDLVYSTPPGELEQRNNKALKEMGVKNAVRLDFFENRAFTPSFDTALTEGLKRMGSTSGRELVVELALGIESKLEARYFVRMVWILADYRRAGAPLSQLLLVSNDEGGYLIAGVTEAGKLVVPVAVEYLTWLPGMEHRGPLYDFAERELHIAGRISPRAKRELSQRGWRIKTRVFERAKPQ